MEDIMYIDKGHKIREDCYPHVSGFFLTVIKYVMTYKIPHLVVGGKYVDIKSAILFFY